LGTAHVPPSQRRGEAVADRYDPPCTDDLREADIPSGSESGSTPSSSTRTSSAAVTAWIEAWQPEEAPLLQARQRANEVGVGAVDPATGAVLRLLAAASSAKAVVELGTGAGVSGLWLLSGMRADGVLTSVDAEAEHQRLAKQSLADAGVPSGRARLIMGRALDVLPRLSDGAYDLVFCDAARSENLDYLAASVRLLRPGGSVVFAGALAGGRIADPAARDADTVALRELTKAVRDDVRLVPALLPVSTGLLVASLAG
jgi:predicted O-methyltransferase YrrM